MNQLLFVTILFFICFLSLVYILIPKYFVFADLKKEILEKQNELQKKQVYFSNLQKMSKQLNQYQEVLEKINSATPNNLSIASLLNYFQIKSLENGLFLRNASKNANDISFAQTKELKEIELKQASFNLDLIGDFYALVNFLKTIEKSSRMIEVQKIDIKLADQEGFLNIKLTLKVFYK